MKLIYLMIIYLSVLTDASADVLINLEDSDEIQISNTQLNLRYTLKIEESSLLMDNQPILANLPSNLLPNDKIDNKLDMSTLPFSAEVISAATETSIEPALIHAVIAVESRHNPRALSKKGAYGLMQLMPATAKHFRVSNKHDTKQNILAGAKYLRELLIMFNGNLSLALAAYNAGPKAVHKHGGIIPPYKETMDYVPKVLKIYRRYSIT
ncbi:MAG: lytic transglycosylase domain-containing protein [Methylotenera sp.]|nr:lytic transglycosylase domain-containing protein [Methylotenera sp.]